MARNLSRKQLAEYPSLDITVLPNGNKQRRYRQRQAANSPFIAWDGEETKDQGYCLFGNSAGIYIQKPRLSSVEMLELLLHTADVYPRAFHVGFAFDYDVNQIIQDMDKLHVAVLHFYGHVTWQGYRIEHIPSKIFKVQDSRGRRITIEDCFHYFRTRYDRALDKYKIGTVAERELVSAGKDSREAFYWKDIDTIRRYWQLELKLMVPLMDRIRTDVNAAGFYITNWHGPGALAKYALRNRKVSVHKKPTPDEIMQPVLHAYSGGWFERFKAGVHDGPIYTADINSAYIYAATLMPALSTGTWHHVDATNADLRQLSRRVRMGVFHIKQSLPFNTFMATCHGVPLPLFQRQAKHTLSHPPVTEGWYWNPEANLVANDTQYTEFVEAWIFDDNGSRPFLWVDEMYRQRELMKRLGNPAEVAFKWALASMYGAFAQRVGWDKNRRLPPRWHQIEWAGWITSKCRSMIYDTALAVSILNGLVSIDTDGIMSTVPFDEQTMRTGIGSGLGQWKIEEYEGVVYVQNGVYWLRDSTGWVEPKLRGIPKGRKITVDVATEALRTNQPIAINRRNFVGYGAALHGRWDQWRTWQDGDGKGGPNYKIDIHKSGARMHLPVFCRPCAQGSSMIDSLHDLALVPSPDLMSAPHQLPWLEETNEREQIFLRHLLDIDSV